jgi:type I restriction enzyme S subunit
MLIYIDNASDLIMNKIANPGTVYFMPEISKPVSLGMNLFLIRIDPKKANPYFISFPMIQAC